MNPARGGGSGVSACPVWSPGPWRDATGRDACPTEPEAGLCAAYKWPNSKIRRSADVSALRPILLFTQQTGVLLSDQSDAPFQE